MNHVKKLTLFLLLAATLCFSGQAMAGYANGTVLQVSGDNALYYVINGYAALVPSPRVFQCLQLGSNQKVMINREQLQAMPRTAFLVQGGGNRIYRIDGEYKRLVPDMNTFRRLGFNNGEIIHLAPAMVDCIPKGPALR
jgi:hypothetical protein